MKKYLIATGLAILLIGCDIRRTPGPTEDIHVSQDWSQEPSGENVIPEGDEKRYAWQKPKLVIDKLGDLEGKVVADIGAGTGYFTIPLMKKADKVIAVDIDPDMIGLIDLWRANMDSTDQVKITTRLALPDDPKLEDEEVDVAIIINTIGYIDDRTSYLSDLRQSLKPDGMLFIVDFKMKRIPDEISAPKEFRVNLLELEEDLLSSGYEALSVDDVSLQYQYIVQAYNLPSE